MSHAISWSWCFARDLIGERAGLGFHEYAMSCALIKSPKPALSSLTPRPRMRRPTEEPRGPRKIFSCATRQAETNAVDLSQPTDTKLLAPWRLCAQEGS